MFNLVKMDIRHLFKSRDFYITLAVTAALLLMVVFLVAAVSSPDTLEAMQAQGAEINEADLGMSEEIRNMSFLDFAYECLSSGFLLIMSGIGMTIFVSRDFSGGYIKNICFARPRRRDYVFSKLLLAGAFSGCIVIVGVLFSLVSPLLFGLRPAASPVLDVFRYGIRLWLLSWAFSLMALSLVALTRNSVLGIVLAVLSGGGVIAQFLQIVCQTFHWPDLWQYLLSGAMRTAAPGTGGFTILCCCVGWAALYTMGSLIAMEKQDI